MSSSLSAPKLPPVEMVEKQLEAERELAELEEQLFTNREQVEVLWLDIGKLCARIVEKGLYKLAVDENGNRFRSAKAYFQDLDRRFHERGWSLSYTTLNRFMGDYRLFVQGHGLSAPEAVALGKSNMETLAPAVRKLEKEGKTEEAHQLVREVVEAALANEGLPNSEVRAAVDEVTDRVMKGCTVEFGAGIFGKKMTKFELYWGGRTIDLLKSEVTEEQAAWLMRRLGIRPNDHLL